MRKLWLLSAGLVALSGSMFADNIWSGSSNGGSSYGGGGVWTCAGCTAVPTTSFLTTNVSAYPVPGSSVNAQIPFWNNPSGDVLSAGHNSNVGDVLSGITLGGTSPVPSDVSGGNVNGFYYANTTTSTNDGNLINSAQTVVGSTVTETPALQFSFQEEATAYNISVLFADSGQNTGSNATGTTFGWYTGSGSGLALHQIGGAIVNNTTGTPTSLATADDIDGTATTNIYGFYATVCYHVTAGACDESITYTTGAGNFTSNISSSSVLTGGMGWNHFALFELADGEEVLGFEDSPWAFGSANATEGTGDYNDVIIGLQGDAPLLQSAAPEPGTIAIMGLGLAGLGMIGRRRFAKKK
ncbi:MAG TPA: PEP-CTERM sorting domain-containing protein [Bryobacteraceae bacterium]|jgi:hypothetical protein|nr:PEP-CTERM sorting domain-containing protein [Bryobacteraceae bacterium]